jgi:hypothetical protein
MNYATKNKFILEINEFINGTKKVDIDLYNYF